MDEAPLLALEKATVLRGRLAVLEEFDFKLYAGERCTIIGPNGSGKSTLLRSLAGLLLYEQGSSSMEIIVFGTKMEGTLSEPIRLVGAPSLQELHRQPLPSNTFELHYKCMGAKMEDENLIEVLNHWGLDHRRHDRIAWLSGGLRRRLEVASAFIVAETSTSPVPVLLDEPSEGLDELGVEILLNKIQNTVNSGHSVVVATHDPRLITTTEETERVETNGMEILRNKRNHTELASEDVRGFEHISRWHVCMEFTT